MHVRGVPSPAMTTPPDVPQQFGHPSTWAAPAPAGQQTRPGIPTKKPKTPLWFLLIFVPGVLIAFMVAIYYENRSAGPTEPAQADESRQAERACRRYIEQQLKAPATARYPTPSTSKDGPEYTVTGSVDSQNSFGALVRTQYKCMVSSEGGGTWKLEYLDFPGK